MSIFFFQGLFAQLGVGDDIDMGIFCEYGSILGHSSFACTMSVSGVIFSFACISSYFALAGIEHRKWC